MIVQGLPSPRQVPRLKSRRSTKSISGDCKNVLNTSEGHARSIAQCIFLLKRPQVGLKRLKKIKDALKRHRGLVIKLNFCSDFEHKV